MLLQTAVANLKDRITLFHKLTQILSERSYPNVVKVNLGDRHALHPVSGKNAGACIRRPTPAALLGWRQVR